MRFPAILVCSAITLNSACADPLTSADREALLENLEKLHENATAKVDARFRLAIAAYREAMSTEDSTMEFYLKCVEKVNYTDQKKKAADFREWKRKEGERLSDQGFRLALRYQLRWLVITLQASSEKAKISDFVPEGQEIVDAVFRDATRLGQQLQTLSQPVTGTVFAKAYEIGNVQNERWPSSPVQIEQFYGQIVFPPLRTPSRVEALRAAWIKRIQQEGIKDTTMGGGGGGWNGNGRGPGGGRRNGPPGGGAGPIDEDRFTTEILPDLQWQMEMDLFRAGDESGAAKRMLAHIEKHLTHKSCRQWSEEFKSLLKPKDATPAPTAATDGAGGG